MGLRAILFLVYLVIGPGFWLCFGTMMLLGRSRMGRLLKTDAPLPQPSPKVCVLIPAKDEGPGIRSCIESVLKQDYPSFEIIAIDDRSTDETGRVLDECAVSDPRVRVLHIQPGSLPEGWLGKCHALHQGAKLASDAAWLWFVDSDVTPAPDALSAALGLSEKRGYDALSLLTRLECHGFWDRLILPLAAAAWSTMYLISLTNVDSRKSQAAANGQFFLVRRAAYEAVGGHEAVRDHITEDVDLMRRLKQADYRTRLYMGARFAATRMHSSLKQMLHGWGRIHAGTGDMSPWRILGAMLFLLISLGAYPIFVYAMWRWRVHDDPNWIIANGIHHVIIFLVVGLVYWLSGNPVRYALLAPLGAVMLLCLMTFALRTCVTRRVAWRGSQFAHKGSGALSRSP